jgi:hypothetical protein
MSDDQETQIVWKLPREQKGRYVAASRREGKTLVAWLSEVCDAAANEALRDDTTKDRGGRMDDAGQSPRPGMDA